MLGAIAACDHPVGPWHEDDIRMGNVDEVRPVVLLREHRHAERQ
jgi:hypothetical protein